MKTFDYQQAFGAWDKTSDAMHEAVETWFRLYYDRQATESSDPCQRIAYTVVSKLVRTVFSEYQATATEGFSSRILTELDAKRQEAVQLALVGGESYLKPYLKEDGFGFLVVPRNHVLVFGRDPQGELTDVGMVEKSTRGQYYYTLLERRRVDEKGYLTIENRLYRSLNAQRLGQQVRLAEHPMYVGLQAQYTYPEPVGSVGLIRVKTPMLNCIDGSPEGVAVYAAAVGLIHRIDENEAQLAGEFQRGQSRILVSRDLLDEHQRLSQNLFVGLDEDPEQVGLHIFSPQLRQASFLARKQEYLRNVESIIGLQRGMLSDVNFLERTATEVAASESEYSLTVMDFQRMWEKALHKTMALCVILAKAHGLPTLGEEPVRIDWGNGVLFDEEKLWQEYKEMVQMGLLAPEVALGWRFDLPCQTEDQRRAIRKTYMPT